MRAEGRGEGSYFPLSPTASPSHLYISSPFLFSHPPWILFFIHLSMPPALSHMTKMGKGNFHNLAAALSVFWTGSRGRKVTRRQVLF